jgi:hypothetical protein
VGQSALSSNTTGSYNTAFGQTALNANTTASYNTAVGYGSGNAITTGAKNTIIGGFSGNQGGLDIRTASNYIVLSDGDGNPRGVFDSSGNLLVGTTTSPSGVSPVKTASVTGDGAAFYGVNNSVSGSYTVGLWNQATSGDRRLISFYAGATETGVGSIVYNGTLTLYNTTSDYRLKTVVGPVANAGQRIDALQPVEYTWNADGSRTRGFLAHEFQEVYPSSVTGDKDAVDADGKPVYQSMQASTSEVIADLVAELQSLRARVAQLESKP